MCLVLLMGLEVLCIVLSRLVFSLSFEVCVDGSRAIFQICNHMPDVHSGVEGGAVAEPMTDMYVSHLAIFTDDTNAN